MIEVVSAQVFPVMLRTIKGNCYILEGERADSGQACGELCKHSLRT